MESLLRLELVPVGGEQSSGVSVEDCLSKGKTVLCMCRLRTTVQKEYSVGLTDSSLCT
jgi:hypothetical protein